MFYHVAQFVNFLKKSDSQQRPVFMGLICKNKRTRFHERQNSQLINIQNRNKFQCCFREDE